MRLLIDFAKPIYNPKAPLNSEEDKKYWVYAGKLTDRIAKKHKVNSLGVETQFDNDQPVFIVRDKKGINYTYDSQGRLKQKTEQKERPAIQQTKGWFW